LLLNLRCYLEEAVTIVYESKGDFEWFAGIFSPFSYPFTFIEGWRLVRNLVDDVHRSRKLMEGEGQ